MTFWSGVYTTSVGNTKAFGNEAKRLIGLVGIFTGVGEIVGGAVFGFLGKVSESSANVKLGNAPMVAWPSFLVHHFCLSI